MNRREFIKLASVTTAGLAASRSSALSKPNEKSLVDVNVSIGRWPFYRLPIENTRKLVAKLRAHSVTSAWAGNFSAAFADNPSRSNEDLARECRRHGRGLLVPFGTVNLKLPEWKREAWRCANEFKMPGLRLFPNFHGYKFTDRAFDELMSFAAERKLLIQIVAALEDERTQPASHRVANLNVTPLLKLLPKFPDTRVMLLNWYRAAPPPLVKQLASRGVYFDIATVENVGGVGNLVAEISPERVVFGSHSPFFYFEAAQLKLRESNLSETDERLINAKNANRLLI